MGSSTHPTGLMDLEITDICGEGGFCGVVDIEGRYVIQDTSLQKLVQKIGD